MDNNTYCLIRNVTSLLIFAGLAAYMDKWWIVFFAFLFSAY